MRISDWSSDVCSSDLAMPPCGEADGLAVIAACRGDDSRGTRSAAHELVHIDEAAADLEGADRRVVLVLDPHLDAQIGRASCGERVVSVRFNTGGCSVISKK